MSSGSHPSCTNTIHLDGRYSFTLPEPLARGELWRDPNDSAEQVFDLLAAPA
jgi:hypothetical protein